MKFQKNSYSEVNKKLFKVIETSLKNFEYAIKMSVLILKLTKLAGFPKNNSCLSK